MNLPNTQLTLIGESVAAKQTAFYLPELKIMLDCGIATEYIPEHIFLTHGHADHSKEIPLSIVKLGNFKYKLQNKINIYVPKEIENYVRDYIHSFYVMSKFNPNHKIHNKYNLIGVDYNSRYPIVIRNKNWIIETIQCYHTVPCVGYGFIEIRKKLIDSYIGLSKEELIQLRKDKTIIEKEVEVPIFCYLGDTDETIFDKEKTTIFKYPIIMVECTFLLDEQLQNAKLKKHIHINSLEPIILNNSKNTFVLYHFSDRYEKNQIMDFFNKKNYKNVLICV